MVTHWYCMFRGSKGVSWCRCTVKEVWHREVLNKYKREREPCSKDTAENTGTHVTEEVKCE